MLNGLVSVLSVGIGRFSLIHFIPLFVRVCEAASHRKDSRLTSSSRLGELSMFTIGFLGFDMNVVSPLVIQVLG